MCSLNLFDDGFQKVSSVLEVSSLSFRLESTSRRSRTVRFHQALNGERLCTCPIHDSELTLAAATAAFILLGGILGNLGYLPLF